MKSIVSRYDITCVTKKVCEQDITCSETTNTVAAKGSYIALKKVERELLNGPRWYHESIKYTIEVRMAESGTKSAKSRPIWTKNALRHPKPRCVDFVGKVRYKHDWTYEKVTGTDVSVAESQCNVCGMEKRVYKWGGYNSGNERQEYKPNPSFLPPISIYVYGMFDRSVGKHVLKAAEGQIHDLLRKTFQKDKTINIKTKHRTYNIDLSRGVRFAKRKTIMLELHSWDNPTVPIRIDGLEHYKYQDPYCSLCGCPAGTGHNEAQHEGKATPTVKSKTPTAGHACQHCDDSPRYCCLCAERIHWTYHCKNNEHRHVSMNDKWYCHACLDGLNLTQHL